MCNGAKPVFDCKRCGDCCAGEGGIVVSGKDQTRLAGYLGMNVSAFLKSYTVQRGSKSLIRTGKDGNCIFFEKGKGCTIHEAKPDVCRAWPFFRGNMVDAVSLRMAKEFCPGISPDVTHAEFIVEGQTYLKRQGLQASDAAQEAVALLPASHMKC